MDSLKLDELAGSLQAFEMTLTSPKKSKRDYDTKCPSRKKGKKALQVTWSDTESYHLSEKEVNESEMALISQPLWLVSLRIPSKRKLQVRLVSQLTPKMTK